MSMFPSTGKVRYPLNFSLNDVCHSTPNSQKLVIKKDRIRDQNVKEIDRTSDTSTVNRVGNSLTFGDDPNDREPV